MAQICEITRKKVPHFSNLSAEEKKGIKAPQRRLLKRKIKVPEANKTINIHVSETGMEILKKAGGMSAFLKSRADNKLSPQLLKLKRKIHGEPKAEKPAAEAAPAAAPKVEAPPPAAPEAEAKKA
jgi:ribosomal protein L28